jgi:transposase-like protein
MGRKKYTSEYKAKLVLEALREENTVSEIGSREGINPLQIQNWKREFIQKSSSVFEASKSDKDTVKELAEKEKQQARLEKKVGQLTLEVDFLKEICDKHYGKGWEDKLGIK